MKMKQYLIIGLFFLSFNNLFGQSENSIFFQTGMFHLFFDKTPVINTHKMVHGNAPQNMFGGYLNDSWGIMYERHISGKSYISAEYMNLDTKYFTGDLLTQSKPFVIARSIKIINLNYNRKVPIYKSTYLVFGSGINYIWGTGQLFLENSCTVFGCNSNILRYKLSDIGLNFRVGIEYDILDWLTIYSNINFIGVIYSGSKNGKGGVKTEKYLSDNYGLHNIPSRLDLSLRFGIGFNFGK